MVAYTACEVGVPDGTAVAVCLQVATGCSTPLAAEGGVKRGKRTRGYRKVLPDDQLRTEATSLSVAQEARNGL